MSDGRYSARKKGKKRPPEPVSGLLGALFEKWGIAEQVARARVLNEWEDRVGERIAERTRPVRVSDGTLFVEVESAAWMMELRMMQSEIMKRVNAGRDRGRIERIVWIQGDGRRSEQVDG